MKCAFIQKQGAPDVLQYGELPTPQPGPEEVLVRITVAAVNPIDTYLRAGSFPIPLEYPYIPGCDLAGVVEAVGSGAQRFKVGDRVWGSNQSLFGRQGTLAEYLATDENWLYPIPEGMTDEQAAAGALVGITAHLGLFLHGNLKPGEIVFVNGGTGGVGSVVIPYAKAAGGKVIATAGTEEKRQLCRDLGADLALDYKSPSLDDEIRTFCEQNGGVDVWWETQHEPTLPRTIALMKQRGRILLITGRQAEPTFNLGQFYTNDLKLIGFVMFNATQEEQQACAEDMNRWFVEGRWKPVIGERFPLSEAAKAHELQEQNTLQKSGTLTGKILVIP